MIKLNFDKLNGMIAAIVQDYKTSEILMLAFMNKEAWEKTLQTGSAHFYSRSRNKLWMKGEESGNTQIVKEILVDCDEDAVVLKVEQIGGAACHTGYNSCFFRKVENNQLKLIKKDRVFDPGKVYNKDKTLKT
ncbi:MAG: phosphoribosyl-AMP cyclohydrolase [bacterium]